MTVFDRVKKLSEKQKISIVELEEKLGFGRNSLYSWKKKTPNGDSLKKVADFFNVSTDYLLGRSEDKTISSNIDDEMYIAFRKNEERLPEYKREEYRKEMERYMRFIMSEMEKED